MFSADVVQELAALAIAGAALVYLVHKLAGWPRFEKPRHREAPVVVGDRLARGLETAARRDESR